MPKFWIQRSARTWIVAVFDAIGASTLISLATEDDAAIKITVSGKRIRYGLNLRILRQICRWWSPILSGRSALKNATGLLAKRGLQRRRIFLHYLTGNFRESLGRVLVLRLVYEGLLLGDNRTGWWGLNLVSWGDEFPKVAYGVTVIWFYACLGWVCKGLLRSDNVINKFKGFHYGFLVRWVLDVCGGLYIGFW
jgi:hypothetical protein